MGGNWAFFAVFTQSIVTYFLGFDIVVVALVIDEFRTEERSSLERARRTISLRDSPAFFFCEKWKNSTYVQNPNSLVYLFVLHCLRIIDLVTVGNVSWRPWCQHWHGPRYWSSHWLLCRWRRLWTLHWWLGTNGADFVARFRRTSWIQYIRLRYMADSGGVQVNDTRLTRIALGAGTFKKTFTVMKFFSIFKNSFREQSLEYASTYLDSARRLSNSRAGFNGPVGGKWRVSLLDRPFCSRNVFRCDNISLLCVNVVGVSLTVPLNRLEWCDPLSVTSWWSYGTDESLSRRYFCSSRYSVEWYWRRCCLYFAVGVDWCSGDVCCLVCIEWPPPLMFSFSEVLSDKSCKYLERKFLFKIPGWLPAAILVCVVFFGDPLCVKLCALCEWLECNGLRKRPFVVVTFDMLAFTDSRSVSPKKRKLPAGRLAIGEGDWSRCWGVDIVRFMVVFERRTAADSFGFASDDLCCFRERRSSDLNQLVFGCGGGGCCGGDDDTSLLR